MTSDGVRWFEDVRVGDQVVTGERRVSSEDVETFARVSGDHNRLHTDDAFAAASPFGRRIAHGLLGAGIGSGLFTATPYSVSIEPSLVALLGFDWQFRLPIFIDDRVHVVADVVEARPTKRPDRGLVVLRRRVINQEGNVAQEGTTPMLLRRSERSS